MLRTTGRDPSHDEEERMDAIEVDAYMGVVIRHCRSAGEQNGVHRHNCKRNTRVRVAQVAGEENMRWQ